MIRYTVDLGGYADYDKWDYRVLVHLDLGDGVLSTTCRNDYTLAIL